MSQRLFPLFLVATRLARREFDAPICQGIALISVFSKQLHEFLIVRGFPRFR
jgi:hypothetical protein